MQDLAALTGGDVRYSFLIYAGQLSGSPMILTFS